MVYGEMLPVRENAAYEMLEIPSALHEKMEKELISEDDVFQTISWCESADMKLLDSETGQFIGHRQIGIITYWVVYEKAGQIFRLIDVYCHRLQIEEEGEWKIN
jgi:hypothetical protein